MDVFGTDIAAVPSRTRQRAIDDSGRLSSSETCNGIATQTLLSGRSGGASLRSGNARWRAESSSARGSDVYSHSLLAIGTTTAQNPLTGVRDIKAGGGRSTASPRQG